MAAKPAVAELLKKKKISEIINPRLVQGSPDISIERAIQTMQEFGAGYIVIAKNKKVLGIFTENDVAFKILGKDVDWDSPVSEFMTREPFVLHPEDSVGQAIDLMGQHRFYHIPLVDDDNKLVNVLSVRTLIRFLAEFYPTEVFNLPPDTSQVMETQEGG